MTTETIDKLYLELALISNAKTARDIQNEKVIHVYMRALMRIANDEQNPRQIALDAMGKALRV